MAKQRINAWRFSGIFSLGIYILLYFIFWDFYVPFKWIIDIPDWHWSSRLGLLMVIVSYIYLMYFCPWHERPWDHECQNTKLNFKFAQACFFAFMGLLTLLAGFGA